MKSLVIIPTYNERENIAALVTEVMKLNISELSILVVDDNSPDGTAQVVDQLKLKYANLHILNREKKQGLGKAYIAGFRWGLEQDFDVLVEMDADFSHRPEDLVKIIEAMKSSDVAVGSRWVKGGATKNWGVMRKIISLGGSFYARSILRFPLSDWTGGFNAWKKSVLQKMDLSKIQSEGYSFQIELKYRASKLGFKIVEVPILFEDRRVGQSKMSSRIVLEALYRVWSIKWML